MTLDEIIKKQKDHLTQAQIKQLAEHAERYKLLNAQRRAEAQSQLALQSRQALRGLQNVGLAGREGKLISGTQAAKNDALGRAYETYDRQLRNVENALTEVTANRMVNANIEAQRRAAQEQAERQRAAMDAEYQQAEQDYFVEEAKYNARLRKKARESKAYDRALNQAEQDYFVDEAKYNARLRKKARADAEKQYDRDLNQAEQDYFVEEAKYNARLKARNPEAYNAYKQAESTIEQNAERWNEAINNGKSVSKSTDKLTQRNTTYEQGSNERVKAIDEMERSLSQKNRAAAALEYPQYSQYLLMPDDQFAVSYAAVKQQAQRLMNEAESERNLGMFSGTDRGYSAAEKAQHRQNADRLEREAMELLAPWDQANYLREGTGDSPSLSSTVEVSDADKTKEVVPEGRNKGKLIENATEFVYWNQQNWNAVPWANESEWNGKNWKTAKEKGWSASDYKGKSKYDALVNEWAYINGRTALLYTQKFNTVQSLGNFKDLFTDDVTRNNAYNWFRDECMKAFGSKDGNGDLLKGMFGYKSEREQMDAMLTLANLMTDEERARFNGMLETYGPKYADEYFEYLYNEVLPQRFLQYTQGQMAFDTRNAEGRIGQSLMSVPTNILQSGQGVKHTLATRQNDPVAAQLGATKYNMAQTMRGAVGQHYGEWGNFAYQTAMSMADSATVAMISGGIGNMVKGLGVGAELAGKIGSTLGGSILGASAFNSSYQEALERGLSPDKARMTAFGNGVNEMLFESLSLDLLVSRFKTGDMLKVSKNGFVNWFVNTLVQGGVEGSEEVFTDMANNLWDKGVNGIYSEELTKLREYISQGMSYEEAKRKVNAEFAEQLGMSFLGGFVSGGVMGGGASFLGMLQNRGNEKVGKGLRQNSRVMNELRNFDFKSEYAQEILQQKNLTNADIADLFNIRQQELLGQYKSDIQKAVEDGRITQEQADLLKKYEQNGVQIVKDGEVVANENGITVEQMPSVQDAIANLDNSAKIQFLDNEEMRSLVKAVGGETVAIIEQSETAERDAEKTYRQTVREINNDTTLSPELKQKRLEAAERTRQNARSEASKIADAALTNKKGIGAKLETDGNGTVKVGKGSGKVTYDFSTKGNPGHQTVDSMTATEQSTLRLAKIVAASRPDVNVKVEAEFGVDENGKDHSEENGYYNPKTKTIHINMSGDNSVLWTLSHELTHHLATTDTEAYTALRTAIETALKDSKLTTTELEERGFEYDLDRVDPYIAREGNLWDALVAFEREEHGYGKYAEEEVVARCCESFLGFDQFVKDFARKQYKSARAVNKFIAQMNIDMQRVSEEARQSAAQRNVWNDESPENQILRQLTEIDRIANLWRIAVNAEAKKRQAAREETRASTKDSVNRSDAEYLDLAKRYESGDKSVEAELRKQVDAAAKAAGYTVKAYHGTNRIFYSFRGANEMGYHFGTKAAAHGRVGRGKAARIIPAYLRANNPVIFDYDMGSWDANFRLANDLHEKDVISAEELNEIKYGRDGERRFIRTDVSANRILQGILKAKGYDSIKYKNTMETKSSWSYIVFDAEQAKSADLVTYDKDGNIIPLSERFKTDRTGEDAWKNEDIRFSMKDNVERKGDLIAVHNLSGDQLLRSMELGGFPMPSIAVMKQSQGHDRYGDVSVIFGKDTIDPKKSSANKVYGGDAWTPTYPTVEYKPRKTVADRIAKTYFKIANEYGYDAARPLYKYIYELERQLNNAGSEKALLDDLYNDVDIMRMYGQINGKERVEDVYQEKRTEMDESDRAIPEYFIKTLGEDFVKEFGNTSGRAALEYKKQFVKDHIKEIERALGDMMRESNVSLEQATYVLENMTTRDYMVSLQRALNIINNNAVKVERIYDRSATEQAIKNSIDEKAYKEWIYDLFHGIIEKSGIRNNKGYYTDSGNQRSWDSLHEDETLENVVRVMRDMTDKGSNAFFSQSEMLALGTRNFKSISEIREHKDQLQHISDEEMSAAKTNIVNQFGDLMDEMRDKSESNYFIGRDRALQAMVEAVRRSRTPQGILNELKQWHGLNVTDDMGRRIADLLDEIADLPTEYFEAKPRRAVGLDEIKAVIMPQGEYAELKEKLDERGIPVVEYEKDNAEDRLRALNSDAVSAQRFSKMDKVRLSTSDGTRTYTADGVTARMYGNNVELDGGKVRQRVQMMEAIAEVNGTARVDAASEEEADAFRRAGAEQVVEELEGHGAKYGTWEFKYEERKFTNDSRYDIKQKQKFAKDILKQVGKSSGFTQAQRVKYGAALGRLMEYLWEMQYGKMDGKVVFDFADRLFDSILNDYTALSEADEEFRSELLANMTKTKNAKGSTVYVLEVNDKQMREIKYAYENAMAYASKLSKALGARVTVKQTENAKTLEDIFTNSTDTRIKSDTNEGDMPGELLRLAQETESRKTNPYAAESEERQALKMGMFEAAMAAAGVEKSTAQQIREAIKETRKAERTKAKTEARKAIDSARLAERMHEGALRAKDRRISENRERALKQHAAEREAKLKQGFRETTQKANETRLKRDMRTIALKWNQRLVKMLANPTEASHVPIQLAREVAELTKTITEYLDSGTERGRINLDKVIKAYQRAFDDQATIAEAQRENPHYDPRGTVIDREMYDEYLVQMMNRMNEIVAEKSFKDLSAYEMKALLDIIRGVAHTVYDANRMIGTSERRAIWEVGDTMIHQFEDAPDVKLKGYLETSLDLRRLARIFSGSNDNAEFVKLVERLNDGAIEKERIAQVLQGIFAPVTEKYGDEIRKWYGKKAEWIDTGITQNGKKVEITKGMRVSLAMHVLNAGNMNHIANGGITIPNRDMYNKGKMTDAYANGETVQLSAEQIEEIISHMTEAEKAYVEAAKEFFHKRTGYYVNKTSLQLLGYRKATVENYFPIHTDKNFTKTDFASLQMDGSIEGQGFLKERVNASNPVYLEDITSVVNRQIRGVALYAGLAVPMRNFNAVMNSTEYFEDENGAWRPRTTVRKAMTQKMGEYGAKVVKGFLEDASEMTHIDVSPMERFAGKLATNYVKAVLLGNMKVALKQVASYPTAAAVIPWKYLAKGLTAGKVDVDLIDQYTPLYQLRREGQANEIASIMAKRGMEQRLPWLLGWITKMDVATVGRIWKAAEYMVADQQKNLPVGSDAYYQAVAKVFNDTVQQTQPNFTPLQRNAALRSKNPIVRSLVLFGTQSMQNGGILIEAAMDLKHSKGKSKAEIQAAKRKLGRAVASQIVQNILLIVASIGVDALRGRMKGWQDKDKEINAESLAKGMGDMFLSNMIGSFLGGSEVYNLISTWYKKATDETAYDAEFTVPALDAMETIINTLGNLPDVIKYLTSDHSDEEKLKNAKTFSFELVKAFGYATGIPLENALKDVFKGIIPAIEDIRDAVKTGELNPWLHQSGKLDKKTTNANYKEWTNLGKKGSTYLYWESKYNEIKGDKEQPNADTFASKLMADRDLTPEEKAMLFRMLAGDLENDGAVVYHPITVNQKLKDKERGTIAYDFTNIDRYNMSQLGDAKYNGFLNAVEMGVPEDIAATAYRNYTSAKRYEKRRGVKADDSFHDWLFKMVSDPAQRAILDMQVVGKTANVDGSIGYKQNGDVYADYSSRESFNAYTQGTKKTEKAEAVSNLEGTPQQKAEAFASMYGYTAKDGIVYNDKGVVQADYTSDEAYKASQMGSSHYEKYTTAVKQGMSKGNALKAVEMCKEIMSDDDKDNSTQATKWIFSTYKNANDRAIAGSMFTTKDVTVKDGRTYDENGYIYRDYTSVAWYKLSNRTLSKDGKNKRYETAQTLTKQGYTAEQVVATYVELDKLSKKSEWQKYLKDNGYTTEQINLFLWSRGWAKLG